MTAKQNLYKPSVQTDVDKQSISHSWLPMFGKTFQLL